ncbi:DUF389 domain-containing protein [Qipengyuania sp.]|uniref:DUF389 domain-containing protein n=1 Tax=Qipengyuania sp. TaxID=2004515 RepID=UPI0035C86E04
MAEADTALPARHHRVQPVAAAWMALKAWWNQDVRDGIDRGNVLRRVASESASTPRYIFMICMSAGIAILGMLLSSPAVVIGAMLLSPLMGPILGAGFALAEGKFIWLRLCAKALFVGTLVAILFCAFIVFVSPLQTVTEEIASRTRPNLFDLLVALFSSLAGSYAMIRGREGTIVGVAIATALMPPLAAVGFGLATWNWTVFQGALMLFITNLLTIALTATVMARLYGFKRTHNSRNGLLQNLGILAIFVLLAIPLGLSLQQIAWEANGRRIVTRVIEDRFDLRSRIDQLSIDWDAEPLQITASVLTPEFQPDAGEAATRILSRDLGVPVEVAINQFQVSADPGAAEQAALAQARQREQSEAAQRATQSLVSELALAAGVDRDEVVVDGDKRRVMASARPLSGLTLEGYRELENRVASGTQDWTVQLRPPLLDLPSIALDDNAPTQAGAEAIRVIDWAARRTGVPIELIGPADALDTAIEQLGEGLDIRRVERSGAEQITARWAVAPSGTDRE